MHPIVFCHKSLQLSTKHVPSRIVHCADALAWLKDQKLPEGNSLFTSLPDSSELKRLSFSEWQDWFITAAEVVLRATPEHSAAIFFQTDVKHGNSWVDKSFLVQRGAFAAGARLLWHKIVCRAPAGVATFGRPGYAHLLCFSRRLVDLVKHSTPDVLPQLGTMTWPKAIGLEAAQQGVIWLRDRAHAHCIIDPFCGIGTVLAVANQQGLDAIGVEIAASRAKKALALFL